MKRLIGVKWGLATMEDKPTLLKFYTDSHVARAIAAQLRTKGVDVVRCQEVGLADVDDDIHLDYATRERRVVITQDADFLRWDKKWRDEGKAHGGIMFVQSHLQGIEHVGRVIEAIMGYYELIAGGAGSVEEDIANRVYFIG
jgi:hypothetical protein